MSLNVQALVTVIGIRVRLEFARLTDSRALGVFQISPH